MAVKAAAPAAEEISTRYTRVQELFIPMYNTEKSPVHKHSNQTRPVIACL